MTYEELEQAVIDYFGDTQRDAAETKSDLLALAQHCETLAESIDTDD